jgi:hypothetical protein
VKGEVVGLVVREQRAAVLGGQRGGEQENAQPQGLAGKRPEQWQTKENEMVHTPAPPQQSGGAAKSKSVTRASVVLGEPKADPSLFQPITLNSAVELTAKNAKNAKKDSYEWTA